MKKIGFFGGCFNPPTIAHYEIVNSAIKECNLDKLIIIPMGDKYQKDDLIPFQHRKKMLELLFENNLKVEISDMQSKQIKRFYAIDSFRYIDERYKDDCRFFIMGIDNFTNMKNWKHYDELIENRKFIVFKRNNFDVNSEYKNVKFIDIDQKVSSTFIRNQIKNDNKFEDLLNIEVVKYIQNNGLYR